MPDWSGGEIWHNLATLVSLWYADMAGVLRRKAPAQHAQVWAKLRTLWQEKHLIPFGPEYTLLVVSLLWLLEVGINVWVIQKVACE